MNKFLALGKAVGLTSTRIGKVTRTPIGDPDKRKDYVLAITPEREYTFPKSYEQDGYCAILWQGTIPLELQAATNLPPSVHSVQGIDKFCDGDIVLIRPSRGVGGPATVRDMFCINSRFNNLLLTERCNSRCLMCSQPPKEDDDSHLIDETLRIVSLIDPRAEVLGFTGGEPTLLKDDFLNIVRACRDSIPNTHLHVLTNGRLFFYKSLCQKLSEIGHNNLMLGIPLYSDIPAEHDYVVQAKEAFNQTLVGLFNLGMNGISIEIRVVIHALTYKRLPSLARFIFYNLPFVKHVALMGLEITGYTKKNLKALWIDPYDYQQELVEAVRFLAARGMHVSIYNHQLCVIPMELWPFARRSISDWKNIYLEECKTCAMIEKCGGLFKSAETVHSSHIRKFENPPLSKVPCV